MSFYVKPGSVCHGPSARHQYRRRPGPGGCGHPCRAGLAPVVIVVSLTAIASFTVPNFSFGIAGRLLRFIFILLGGAFGLFGVQFGALLVLIYTSSIRSFGYPYLAPMSPLILQSFKDLHLRIWRWRMDTRPLLLGAREPLRQARGQQPRPGIEEEEKEKAGKGRKMTTEKIHNRQLVFMLFMIRSTVTIATLPVLTTGTAEQDAWLSAIVSLAATLLTILLIGGLAVKFPEETVIEYSRKLLGKTGGTIISFFFLWTFLYTAATEVRIYAELLNTGLFPLLL